MTATLLRRFNLLPWLVLLLVALGLAQPAQATHLLGGEMTYRYLDANGPMTTAPYRYEITTSLYVTCSSAATATYLDIDIFNKATGAHLTLTSSNIGSSNASVYGGALELTQSSISTCTSIAVPPGCTITGASQPYQLQKFVGIVCLPASPAGYYALTAPSGARNNGINNLANGASSGYNMALYCTLALPVYANHSPVFTGDAVGLICSGDTTVVLNNAVDADGDRLAYAFGQPYTFPNTLSAFSPPPPYVPYTTTGGYSAATPLGTGAGYYAKINASTGITKYLGGPTVGNRYGIAIDVTEYRTINGVEVALGTTRRDIQILVGSCPATSPPTLPVSATLPRAFTIEAGSTLSVPLSGSQPAGHPLTLTATSVLLDGAGGYNATFGGNTGTPTYTGSPVGAYTVAGSTGGSVAGTFVYTPACTEARATPYDVTLTLQDLGCAGKITADVLRITVIKPTGPTAISGSLCGLNTTQTYTASGGTAPGQIWTVTGGTIVGSATANPITVQWPTAGTGTVKVQGVSQYGCLLESVTQSVTVSPPPMLTITGASQPICQGSSVTLTVSGGTAPYTVTGGAAPVSGAGPFVLTPTQTTTYTIAGSTAGGVCPATGQVTVTVQPLPTANAGAAVTICPSGTGQLGAAPVAGNTYSWSPATGLSNATIANPTVTMPNTTGTPITQTYTLTVTGAANCQATSSVVVTVGPPPTAAAGAATTICSGSTGQLGAAPVAGFTYSWSPATGLSNAGIANPTVTLTNTTSSAITQAYTLTVTGTGNCQNTGTVTVTVNPAPTAVAGMPVTFCSGGTGQLGAAAVAGLTYSWSPAAGLSSTIAANPIVTLTNATSTAITQTYTLTVTNANGCVKTATVAVTIAPLPVANAGAAVAVCSGSSGQLGAAPVAGNTYSWSPTTGLSNATIANPTITLTNTTGAATTQTYTLTVTSAANCVSTGTVAVTVTPVPVAAPGAAVTFCSGSTGQLGAAPVAGFTYSWSPATGLNNPNIANPTVTLTNTTGVAITRTYTLTMSGAGSCSATGTVAVTVNPLPVANAGAAVAICSGGSAQLGAAAVTGLTYSWSPATGLSSATAANPTVTLTNSTSAAIMQTYTLTVTSATGCVATSTVVVTVNPPLIANAGVATTICSGGTGQLGAASATGFTYSWSPATGLSSATVANPTVTLTNTTTAATTQTYTLTTTNTATGCSGTAMVVVTINPLPTAVPGAAVAFCSGGTGQLGAAATTGLSYSWSPTTGLSSATAANPTVTLTNNTSAPITQTYTLTVTNAAGCVGTGTVAVTVNPIPVATAGAATAICSGGTGQLGAAAIAGNVYSWSPTTGLSSTTAANPTVTLTNTTTAATTQTYTLTVTSAAGCVSTGTVIITVNPLPVAQPGAAVTSCSGAGTQLGAAPVAGNTYSWSPAMGLSNATAANPTVTLTNTTSAATTQTYTLTVTSAAGCMSTGTVAVTVNPAVAAGTISADQTVCAGSVPAPFTSTVAASGGPGTYAYYWESSPNNSTWTGIAGAAGPTYTPGPVTATTYYRRRVVAGACGTYSSNVVKVETQPLLTPAVALPVPPAQCAGTAFTFTPTPTNAGAAPTYQWLVNNAQVATGATYTSSTLADGDVVRVVLTPTVGFCASGPAIASVRVSLTPVAISTVAISASTVLPVCLGAPVTFGLDRVANVGTSPQYQWQIDGVSVTGATNPIFTTTTLRDGQAVTLVVRSTNACGQPATATSNAVRATINPPVHVSAGPDKTITEGETVVLEGTADGIYPVTWTPAQTLTFASGDQLRPVASPPYTTTYTLSAGTGYCADRSTVTVTVLPRVRIPNAFSPNGDNDDDTWQIDNLAAYQNNHVVIFNRWGIKIFDTANYSRSNEWNGTVNGQTVPFGTYYYLITLGNGKSLTGPLTVIQ